MLATAQVQARLQEEAGRGAFLWGNFVDIWRVPTGSSFSSAPPPPTGGMGTFSDAGKREVCLGQGLLPDRHIEGSAKRAPGGVAWDLAPGAERSAVVDTAVAVGEAVR